MEKRLIGTVVLCACLLLAACGRLTQNKIRIAYGNWAEGIAITHLTKEILTEQGFQVEILNADIAPVFTALARGKADVFMDSWLPVTHADYFEKYGDRLEMLGQVYDSARIGLVVPTYVTINSLEELNAHKERFGGEIVGIDAGTGLMRCSETALTDYGLDYKLLYSSGPAMTALLKKAIDQRKWIVVTGWTPHWKFDRFDLKFLKDPKNVYGEAEQIHSIARRGFSHDHPYAAAIIRTIHLEDKDLSSLMRAINDTKRTEKDAVRAWMTTHRELVDSWIPKDGRR